jgi:hypothetical protein
MLVEDVVEAKQELEKAIFQAVNNALHEFRCVTHESPDEVVVEMETIQGIGEPTTLVCVGVKVVVTI